MELTINGKQIQTNSFVQKILSNISWGILNSLDEIPEHPHTVKISLAHLSDLEILVDGEPIRMNRFVHKTTRNIIMGMVNALDDIPEHPEHIILDVSKK